MNFNPKISVILPTYNRRKIIGKSIISVLEQTYHNLELVIIDDASTDNTYELIKDFTDSRIIYLNHKTNRGGSAARNTGLNAAQGELIAFQDSDDIWLPEKLEKQVTMFRNSTGNLGVVYTQCSRFDNNTVRNIPEDNYKENRSNYHLSLLANNFITLPSVLINKSCLDKVGHFDDNLPRLQDWDLFIRIAKYFEFSYIPEPLVLSYFTEGSISSDRKAHTKALELIFNKYSSDYIADKQTYDNKLITLFRYYKSEKNLEKLRFYLISYFKRNLSLGLFFPILISYIGIKPFNSYWDTMDKIQDGLKK